MWDVFRKLLKPDNTEGTMSAFAAKVTAAWAALFAGISLGDLATLAALIWTALNIVFLLYDRLVKIPRKEKAAQSQELDKE